MSGWVAGATVVGSIGSSILGGRRAKKEAEKNRRFLEERTDPFRVGSKISEAQNKLMPNVFASEVAWRPQMETLGFESTIRPFRQGTPQRELIKESIGDMGQYQQDAMSRYAPQYAQTVRATNPELYRQLGLSQDHFSDLVGYSKGQQGYAENLQQQAMGAGYSPIQQELQSQALSDLQKGREYTEREARDVEQSSRAAFGARGRVTDNAAIAGDILARFGLGSQLEQQRRGFAMGTDQLRQSQQQANRQFQLGAGNLGLGAGQLGRDVGSLGLGVGQLAGMAKIDPLRAPGMQAASQYNLPQMLGLSGQVMAASQPAYFNPFDPAATSIMTQGATAQANLAGAQYGANAQRQAGMMGMLGNLGAAYLGNRSSANVFGGGK